MEKNIVFYQDETLQRIDGNSLLNYKKYEERVEMLKLVSVDEKLIRYQSKWLRQATRMNKSFAYNMLN